MENSANTIKEIESVVLDVVNRLCCTAELQSKIVLGENDTEKIIINISSSDAQLLIGHNGRNLIALEQISRVLVNKKRGEFVNFSLDVNDYRESRKRKLVEAASRAANKAKTTQTEVVFPPMTSFERRVIHNEVSQIEGVVTESRGEGRERHIVILPHN